MIATGGNDDYKFSGFSPATFQFLEKLSRHNNQKWFHKNHTRYKEHLVNPSKQFVVEIGEFMNFLNPQFSIEPKFNKTLMRISRDMRFTKGKPYREFFLIGFHRWKWDSELFLYIDQLGIEIGIFINNKKKGNEPSIRHLLKHNKELLLSVCDEYGIGKQYTLSALKHTIDILSERFNPKKDFIYFQEVDYIILSKVYNKQKIISLRGNLLTEAMTHFSTLYPLWILSESTRPEKDLLSYSERLGPVRQIK